MPNNEKVKDLIYKTRCWLSDLRADINNEIDDIQHRLDEVETQTLRESRAEPVKQVEEEPTPVEVIIADKGKPERE